MTDSELIMSHGGPSAFARLVGLEGLTGARRVSAWKRRGIPPKVKLKHLELFQMQLSFDVQPAKKDCK